MSILIESRGTFGKPFNKIHIEGNTTYTNSKRHKIQMEDKMKNFTYLLITVLLLAASTTFAQEKKDKTGTNPVNFTYDYRLITEMQQFKDNGGQ